MAERVAAEAALVADRSVAALADQWAAAPVADQLAAGLAVASAEDQLVAESAAASVADQLAAELAVASVAALSFETQGESKCRPSGATELMRRIP